MAARAVAIAVARASSCPTFPSLSASATSACVNAPVQGPFPHPVPRYRRPESVSHQAVHAEWKSQFVSDAQTPALCSRLQAAQADPQKSSPSRKASTSRRTGRPRRSRSRLRVCRPLRPRYRMAGRPSPVQVQAAMSSPVMAGEVRRRRRLLLKVVGSTRARSGSATLGLRLSLLALRLCSSS